MSSKHYSFKYSYEYSEYSEGTNLINKNASSSEDSSKKQKKLKLLASVMIFLAIFFILLILTKDLSKLFNIIKHAGAFLTLISIIYFFVDKLA